MMFLGSISVIRWQCYMTFISQKRSYSLPRYCKTSFEMGMERGIRGLLSVTAGGGDRGGERVGGRVTLCLFETDRLNKIYR